MRVATVRWCGFLVVAVSVLVAYADRAEASTLSLGSRIPIDATTFALPIDITGAVQVSSWTFDLTYDPADVEINTGCTPGLDIYCDFTNGPVTEGNFFAAGAPFNVFTPGFIVLDPITLAQTGQLLAVTDTYGGPSPSPSGDGVLAYVEFTQLGTGTSPITVNGSGTSDVPVPEPGTVVLLTTGLAGVWRLQRRLSR